MYCFYVDTENCDNHYYSYEVIGNNLCIYYYNWNFDFVNCFSIYCVDYYLIFDSLICCMNYFVIYCLDNYYGCWNNFYFCCLNSFYSYHKMNFVIDCFNNAYFCLIGNLMFVSASSLSLIVGSCFDYLIYYIYFVKNFLNFFVRVIYLYN